MANSNMIKVGGLWSNKDKDGNSYLTGKLNPGVKILIFKNKYRESENHPTHILYIAPVEQQGQGQQEESADDLLGDPATDRPIPRQATQRQGAPASRQAPAPPPDYDDLDDPFADDERPIARGQRQRASF